MANIKISELNALTERADNDLLAIVDTSADETKKIQVSDLVNKNIELIAVSDTAPSECSIGDKYYNTTDKEIYTATGTNTWSETGTTPISGILYIVYNEQASYSWDGTDLVSVGGGKEDIVIDDEEPTDPDIKLWIDTSALSQSDETNMKYNDNGEYKDIYAKAFDTLPIGTEVDYDGETAPTGWTEITRMYDNSVSDYSLSNNSTKNITTCSVIAPRDGTAIVIATATYESNASGYRQLNIAKNETGMSAVVKSNAVSGSSMTIFTLKILEVSEGDTFCPRTIQNSGSALSCSFTIQLTYI